MRVVIFLRFCELSCFASRLLLRVVAVPRGGQVRVRDNLWGEPSVEVDTAIFVVNCQLLSNYYRLFDIYKQNVEIL